MAISPVTIQVRELNGPAFALDQPKNVSDAGEADALASRIGERVAFFDWLEA